jgi:hypothetical protein
MGLAAPPGIPTSGPASDASKGTFEVNGEVDNAGPQSVKTTASSDLRFAQNRL